MTIEDKLLYLNETKEQIEEAIKNKGGKLAENAPFKSFTNALKNAPVGSAPSAPSGKGLFLWVDAKENGENCTHSSDPSVWYPLTGIDYGSGRYSRKTLSGGVAKVYPNYVYLNGLAGYLPITPEYGKMMSCPSGCTIEAVINAEEGLSTDVSRIIISSQQSGGVSLHVSPTNQVKFQPYAKKADGTYGYRTVTTTNSIENGTFYYIVGMFDPSNDKLSVRYISTKLGVNEYAEVIYEGDSLANFHKQPLCVGYNPSSNGGTVDGSYTFKGGISSIRVYSRALSEEELNMNYLYEKNRYDF